MPNPPALTRFRKLVDEISLLYTRARRVQVQFAWETGRRIVQEEQNGAMRAKYGSGLLKNLSVALTKKFSSGFSERTLEKMRNFYMLNRISPTSAKLNWNHYVELLPIRDEKTRRRLEARAVKEGLDSRRIRRLVHSIRHGPRPGTDTQLPPLKRPGDLQLYTAALSPLKRKLKPGEVLIDCGFFVHWPARRDKLAGLTLMDPPRYTYAATVERVIDGDTLLVLIDVGFRIEVLDKLRLRGIDTPELGTPEGEKAKRFVQKILPAGSLIVLKSHKYRTDPYGRFVADVFYKQGAASAESIVKNGVYLNQQLLDEGLAGRMRE